MKDRDKINKFFVQRLGDDTPGDDGWNMPSDGIFESAKVHFPKKKKKKRPFFIWFGSGLILTGILAIAYLGISDNALNGHVAKSATAFVNTENNNTAANKSIITKSEESGKTKTIESIITNTKNSIASNSTETSNQAIESNTPVTIKTEKKDIEISTEISTSFTQLTTPKNTFNTNVNSISKNTASISSAKQLIPTVLLPQKKDEHVKPLINSELIKNNEVTNLLKSNDLATIESITSKNNEHNIAFQELDPSYSRKFQRWEVGLTHARFILPFNFITLKDDNGAEEISFDAKNINFNIPVTRRFNRRWSLTSGYSYTDFDLDLKLKEEIVFNQNATEDIIESIIDEIISKGVIAGSIEFNDQTRNVDLEFMDNLGLMDGDLLTLNAVIPLRLKLHQMPILLNYHFGKSRWEWSVHTGIALEYFDVTIPFVDMDARKENMILTNPVVFESIRTNEFTLGVFLGGGVKYHLNDQFNIGLNTKIDILGIPFARYEIGCFHTFSRLTNNKSMMQY